MTFPNADQFINLSLPAILRNDKNGVRPDIGVRNAIRDYRHLIRLKLLRNDGHLTPWGEWKHVKPGFHVLTGNLNNRFLDWELSAPFTPVSQAKEIAEDLDHLCGQTEMSAAARQEVRRLGREHLLSVLRSGDQNDPGKPPISMGTQMIRVPVVHKENSHHLLDFANFVERELVWACNAPASSQMNSLLAEPAATMRKRKKTIPDEEMKNYQNAWQVSHGYSVKELLPLAEPMFLDKEQWFFLDLTTMAILSNNFMQGSTSSGPVEKAWMFFSTMASLAGLPCSVLSMHGLEPTRRLSPSNSRFCPVQSILYGMWSLGCSDGFQVVLSLNHPNKMKRGVYIGFELQGEGATRLSEVGGQFDHPVHGNVGKEVPKTATEDFDAAFAEASADEEDE